MAPTEARRGDEDLDLVSMVYELTGQIPRGMVSTYGDIAAALGDPVAARAVGEVLSHNPAPIVVPCHRVVYSTGRTGWYGGHGRGSEEKVQLLRSEGVTVIDGQVQDLAEARFTGFKAEPVLRRLREEQERIASLVKEEDAEITRVAGLDVSYADSTAFGALVVCDRRTGSVVEERTSSVTVRFPYIPTYLSYREIPALRPLVRREEGIMYLVDGHGVLHPRGAGIASQLGVMLDVPTVGAAKSLLVGKVGTTSEDAAPISLGGRVRGCRLGTGKRFTYVSVGHRVTLPTAVAVCRPLMRNGIPLPLRRAHDLATEARRSGA